MVERKKGIMNNTGNLNIKTMENYDSLMDALTGLKKRGYTEDFNLEKNGLHCPGLDIRLKPEEFTIDEYFRFEGASDPDENSIVYAISSNRGIKGVLVNAYGVYAEDLSMEMSAKLK
jgi:hypothetical protein